MDYRKRTIRGIPWVVGISILVGASMAAIILFH